MFKLNDLVTFKYAEKNFLEKNPQYSGVLEVFYIDECSEKYVQCIPQNNHSVPPAWFHYNELELVERPKYDFKVDDVVRLKSHLTYTGAYVGNMVVLETYPTNMFIKCSHAGLLDTWFHYNELELVVKANVKTMKKEKVSMFYLIYDVPAKGEEFDTEHNVRGPFKNRKDALKALKDEMKDHPEYFETGSRYMLVQDVGSIAFEPVFEIDEDDSDI